MDGINDFPEDHYEDELQDFLRHLKNGAPEAEQLEELIRPYLEKLEHASNDPDDLLEDLEEKTDRVSDKFLEALDDPGEECFTQMAASMAEWSVPAVALGFCLSNGSFGNPEQYDPQMTQLADGMAKVQLGILHCLHSSDYSYEALMRIAPLWMQARQSCREMLDILG